MNNLRLPVSLLFGVFALTLGITSVTFAQTEEDFETVVSPAEWERLTQVAQALPVLAEAPELHEGAWLNSDAPLKLNDLKGKVVLLEMWTFGCINCIRTIPYVSEWYEAYRDNGFVVIGNHYPEFDYESELANVREALPRLGIEYPVLLDNQRETWGAYNNRYWPTMYLMDKWGNIRYWHIGEGKYEETEEAIRALLTEEYDPTAEDISEESLLSLTPTIELNVRTGPGTQFERINWIAPNEAYYILEEVDGLYKIRLPEGEGYVSGEFVSVNDTLSATDES